MTSLFRVTGMTVPSPVARVVPAVTGLVAWAYFGNLFVSDNSNLAPGGAPFVDVGSGPELVASNYIRCFFDAAIRTDWQRYTDGSNGPVTLVAVGRTTATSGIVQPLIGDQRVSIQPKQKENANGGVPSVSSYRALVAGPCLSVTTTLAWRAYALTEPAGGSAGTSYIMDLTADTQASTVQTGQTSLTAGSNYMTFGTTPGVTATSKRMDIAFGAIVSGRQMSKADIITEIMDPARVNLTARGITGV